MKFRAHQETDWTGKSIWIIGASSGIGAETAREFARRGARVTVSARRADALSAVAGEQMRSIPFDATDTAAVGRAYEQLIKNDGEPDLVLYAAGMWKQTPRRQFDASDFAAHVETNLQGLANVLAVVIPQFVERGSGTIVGVASVAGYRGLPGGEYYGPTKAAQINLLEALRGSLISRDIRVVTVCPGFVETDMTQGNDFPMPFMVSAERAAREIVDGIENGHQEIVFPTRMMLAMKAARLLPVRAWTQLTAR